MKIVQFIRSNVVLAIAILAAAVTTCFVPPDKQWLRYFDWKTLTCLFCMMNVNARCFSLPVDDNTK